MTLKKNEIRRKPNSDSISKRIDHRTYGMTNEQKNKILARVV